MFYIPTKEELEEMGFTYEDIVGEKTIRNWRHDNFPIALSYRGNWFIDQREEKLIPIYPRSREHLEQIILAFTPTK